MKNWKINSDNELIHGKCGKISSTDYDGNWVCLDCGTKAPEGMGFVADLSRCRTVPYRSYARCMEEILDRK